MCVGGCGQMCSNVVLYISLMNLKHGHLAHPNSHAKDLKAYGDVPPKWVTFSPKILRHGSILVKKILRRGSHFAKIVKNL